MNKQRRKDKKGVAFLQWALPRMGYRWEGYRKPRGQVLKRIRERMQELGLSGGYEAYRDYLEQHPLEWDHLDRLCDVTISKFFRDRKLWDYLRDEVLPERLQEAERGGRPVEIWSAGCCNGEEPYSFAIVAEQLARDRTGDLNSGDDVRRLPLTVLATDRNLEVLERARKGRYPHSALKEMSGAERAAFFHRIPSEEEMELSESDKAGEMESQECIDTEADPDSGGDAPYAINDRLRSYVTFLQHDIRKEPPDRIFDLVLCRNLVFTYFVEEQQREFLERLKPLLPPGGRLIIGSNETIPETGWLERSDGNHPVFRRSG